MNTTTDTRETAAASANSTPAHDASATKASTTKSAQPSSVRRPGANPRQNVPALPAIFAAPPGVLMNAFLRDPWTFIRYMQEEMDRDFPTGARPEASAARNGRPDTSLQNNLTWAPPLEVFRRGTDLVVHAELPGLRTDDIDLSVQEDALVISGERKQQQESTTDGVFRTERRYGAFHRAVALPEGVNEEQISASFSDGVLEVRIPLPEPEEKTPRKIKIS